jgi:zinc-finger of transposase IS204/IS1001/IS1096/IS1165
MTLFVSGRGLLPKGLLVESISQGQDGITVAARALTIGGTCPSCGQTSQRVHSRYRRTLADLPFAAARPSGRSCAASAPTCL